MKKLLIIAATLSVVGSNAQTSQKGCVNIFNSGNTPLQGVQVMAYGASPTDTDNQGKFLLTFPSMSVGNAISIPQIYKIGYELVNNASTEWILSDKREMKFVMAPEGTLDEAKAKYYKIGSENYSAKYSLAVAELNRRYHASEIDADTRKMELDSLNVELSAYMSKLDEYSSKLARINPDDLDAIEKRAFDLLNKGDIDAALMVYDDARLVEMANTKSQGADIAEE
ncbi:MAG: tetratricopeptide repeat protein, partial [Bacteroidaceae bacterium]|nr:tetratricopeptide repeat protein [Bacteroidaceae bacterium]